MAHVILSVIIPAYNVEKTLKRAMDSLSFHNSDEIEVLVVDDGSIDSTVKIFRENRKLHCRIVGFSRNRGLWAARDYGIRESSGSYFTFVDADDWVDSDYLDQILSAIQANPDAELLLTGYRCHYHESTIEKVVHTPVDLAGDFVLDRVNCTTWAKVYCKKLISKHGISHEPLVRNQDAVFNARFIRYVRKWAVIPGIYYNYDCAEKLQFRPQLLDQTLEAHRRANLFVQEALLDIVPDQDKFMARRFRFEFVYAMRQICKKTEPMNSSFTGLECLIKCMKDRFAFWDVLLNRFIASHEKILFLMFRLNSLLCIAFLRKLWGR